MIAHPALTLVADLQRSGGAATGDEERNQSLKDACPVHRFIAPCIGCVTKLAYERANLVALITSNKLHRKSRKLPLGDPALLKEFDVMMSRIVLDGLEERTHRLSITFQNLQKI